MNLKLPKLKRIDRPEKKKILLISDRFTDMIDLLSIIIMKYLENNRIAEDVKEYISICKDLFYYRAKSKNKLERINLLFYSIYVLVKRQTRFQQIEYKVKESNFKKSAHKPTDYLYVLIPVDTNIMSLIKNERDLSKVFKRPEKLINLKNSIKITSSSNNLFNVSSQNIVLYSMAFLFTKSIPYLKFNDCITLFLINSI